MDRKLIVFDLDGTLVDSARDLATAVNLMRRHFGLPPLSVETVKGYVGNGVRMLVTRALEGTGIDVEEALRIQAPIYKAHAMDETALYPGVREVLERLRTLGHVMAVATNKPAESCGLILERLGIREFFLEVLAGGTFPVLKPDPAMILHLMVKAGVAAKDTWVVGDNYTDVEAAHRAGANSVFLTYGYGHPGQETPTVCCNRFDELLCVFGD